MVQTFKKDYLTLCTAEFKANMGEFPNIFYTVQYTLGK